MNNIDIGGRTIVNPADVILLVGDVNYTIVHYANGTKSIVASTLKSLEAKFVPHQFYRIHKSYLVNLNYAKRFFEASNYLQMSNNQKVMVSRRRKLGLKKVFLSFEKA